MTDTSSDDFSDAKSDPPETTDSSEGKAFFLADSVTAPNEFFDRERWHDIESEDDSLAEEEGRKYSTFTSFSLAVLLLVSLGAVAGGLAGAYALHSRSLSRGLYPDRYNIDHGPTPAQWIGYSVDGIVLCEVSDPACFGAFQDEIWVIGESDPPSLLFFDKSERPFRTVSLKKAPLCLAVGEAETLFPGNVLVAHSDSLVVYSPDGDIAASWSLPNDKGQVRGLALTDDAVFAADSAERVVYRFDRSGRLVREIGRVAAKPAGTLPETPPDPDASPSRPVANEEKTFEGFAVFNAPMTLTVSPANGLLYVANPGKHRIEAFTQDGYWEPSLGWGHASTDLLGFAGCCNPVALATLRDGRIVTAEKSIPRVKIFRKDRRLDCIVAGPEILGVKPANIPQLESVRTVADNNERPFFIAPVENDTVLVFDPVWKIVRYCKPIASFSESETVAADR